jgi:hypothetical protein
MRLEVATGEQDILTIGLALASDGLPGFHAHGEPWANGWTEDPTRFVHQRTEQGESG